MAPTIIRVGMTDDDGSKTTGTIFNNAWLNASIYDAIDALIASGASWSVNNFKLSLTTGLPDTTADVTAATTIYATPFDGNQIVLFNSSGVPTVYASAQFSIAVPATTSQMYDLFAIVSGGVPALEALAWSSDTARATAIVLTTTGAYCKSGDLTRRYLGSFRTTTVSGQTEDSLAKRYLFNLYHQRPRPARVVEATATWPYTLNTFHQANAGAAGNQLDVVIGVAGALIEVEVVGNASNSAGGNTLSVSIGEDSTTTPVAGVIGQSQDAATAGANYAVRASLKKYPAVGRHTYNWLEKSTVGGTTTWRGTSADFNSGIHAMVWG